MFPDPVTSTPGEKRDGEGAASDLCLNEDINVHSLEKILHASDYGVRRHTPLGRG